jgi:hypothetical protein
VSIRVWIEELRNLGFSGILDRVRLMDLVQVASIAEMSADLEIHSAMGGGLITIRSGQIWHCETGPIFGEEALRRVLTWPQGSFEFKPEQSEIRQSIKKTWEQLLIESIVHRLQVDPESTGEERSFSGRIDGMELLELVEFACLSKADRLLRVNTEANVGVIVCNARGVCHAEYGSNSGESAFTLMAPAEEGTFESARPDGDEPVTIQRPWDDLLVEAKRHRDEKRSGVKGGNITNFIQQMQRIKITEKIRLALTGQKEVRMILARDSNRMVQLAVVENPKLSEFEVILMASSKSTDEEVFRRIAADREWMRLRQVRAALVGNPKCPVPIACKLIETLGTPEWKRLSGSTSVQSVVRAMAKRLINKKT